MAQGHVLFRDRYYLAWNKLPGELVQPDRVKTTSLQAMLNRRNKEEAPQSAFFEAVHRLDRPTSGVVLFAKKKIAFSKTSALFARHDVERVYWAVVENAPPAAAMTLAHVLTTDHRKNKSYVRVPDPGQEPDAVLELKTAGRSERYTFLVLRLVTGKQHQIRAQLSAIGCPVKGDVKYGARRGNPDRSILLHARSLNLIHPFTGKQLTLVAPPPSGVLWELFAACERGDEDQPPGNPGGENHKTESFSD